jgi:myosin heavy subunit
MQILDDESNFPQSTDASLLEKLHYVHSTNRLYGKPRLSSPMFSITHYAGEVVYEVRNFLDKNRDLLRSDVVEMLIDSKNLVIAVFRKLIVLSVSVGLS